MKYTLWGVWLIFLATNIYALLEHSKTTGGRNNTTEIASIIQRKGNVNYRRANDFDWIEATNISSLHEDEMFSTGANSGAKLSFGDNRFLELAPNTLIKIETPKNLGGDVEIFLVSGKVKASIDQESEQELAGTKEKKSAKMKLKSTDGALELTAGGSAVEIKKESQNSAIQVTTSTGSVFALSGDQKNKVAPSGEAQEIIQPEKESKTLAIPLEIANSTKLVALSPAEVTKIVIIEETKNPNTTQPPQSPPQSPPESTKSVDDKPSTTENIEQGKKEARPDLPKKPLSVLDLLTLTGKSQPSGEEEKIYPITLSFEKLKFKPSRGELVPPPRYGNYKYKITLANDKNLSLIMGLLQNCGGYLVSPKAEPFVEEGSYIVDSDKVIAALSGPVVKSASLHELLKALKGKIIFSGELSEYTPRHKYIHEDSSQEIFYLVKNGNVSYVNRDLLKRVSSIDRILESNEVVLFKNNVTVLSP